MYSATITSNQPLKGMHHLLTVEISPLAGMDSQLPCKSMHSGDYNVLLLFSFSPSVYIMEHEYTGRSVASSSGNFDYHTIFDKSSRTSEYFAENSDRTILGIEFSNLGNDRPPDRFWGCKLSTRVEIPVHIRYSLPARNKTHAVSFVKAPDIYFSEQGRQGNIVVRDNCSHSRFRFAIDVSPSIELECGIRFKRALTAVGPHSSLEIFSPIGDSVNENFVKSIDFLVSIASMTIVLLFFWRIKSSRI